MDHRRDHHPRHRKVQTTLQVAVSPFCLDFSRVSKRIHCSSFLTVQTPGVFKHQMIVGTAQMGPKRSIRRTIHKIRLFITATGKIFMTVTFPKCHLASRTIKPKSKGDSNSLIPQETIINPVEPYIFYLKTRTYPPSQMLPARDPNDRSSELMYRAFPSRDGTKPSQPLVPSQAFPDPTPERGEAKHNSESAWDFGYVNYDPSLTKPRPHPRSTAPALSFFSPTISL